MTRRTLALWVLAAPLAVLLAVPVLVLVLFALGAIPDDEPFDFDAWPDWDDES